MTTSEAQRFMPRAMALSVVIFTVAFLLRLAALLQYAEAPNFDNPIGDSAIYVERARDILSGNFLGDEVSFHSSPSYPYLVALLLGVTGGSFMALRLVQAVLGSLACVVISLLARRLSGGDSAAQIVAGLGAACYATLVFFDLDLLMISQTILFVGCSLLLLLRAHDSGSAIQAGLAGLSLGLAATDKPNLLLFLPVAAWFLADSMKARPDRWRWRRAAVFCAATLAVIAPITVRNLSVGGDLVLVSSNAGVNLYIGNNERARGVYALPPESGLRNTDLHGSSVRVAEQALGRGLKPSEVSRYWAGKAMRFAFGHPLQEARLIGLKLLRTVGAYEIPNHLNFYFIRAEFVPALRWAFVGAWLVFPLGLLGIGWRWSRGPTPADRLLAGYLIAYAVSLLAFFVTARYRLPLVPVLLVYASVAAVGIIRARRALSARTLAALALLLVAASVLVHWPARRFGYSFDRVAMATKYFDRSRRQGATAADDRRETLLQLKWAVETDPRSVDAHYNLGVAYESVGYYSGAEAEFREALTLDPGRRLAAVALTGVRGKYARGGDRTGPEDLPETPFERARSLEAKSDRDAERLYLDLVRRDPFHFRAYRRLEAIYAARGNAAASERMRRRAEATHPDRRAQIGD